MRELVIKNVKTSEYELVNLNKHYDHETENNKSFEFLKNNVVSPYKDGEGNLTVNFYTLQPGKSNYPYHQHFGREEVFYIISGTATLKTPKGDIEVSEGDVIVIPPNENGAHMLTNNSASPVVYLDIDTKANPDVILYPDSGNVRIMAGGMQKSFKMDYEVNNLDGE
ncbi:Cupin domain-containing protein [Butyrivibrio sp. ob235]|uniref:cupin domain-containing protein n=1 Tax=Butyrivibrio sp. ob235 TaxID=1761780 RepID=UPI0008B8AA3C|nr:cupin domain-containing protein [Butyrivibrio sp. ob235]SEL64917.1 Cupin domain-containing protein [Butyrivibrio sp. ob235]